MTGVCKFCGQNKEIIKSHIIPKSFYQLKKQERYEGIEPHKLLLDKVHSQNGHKEPLLCKECDNKLGYLDNYAYRFLFNEVPQLHFHATPIPGILTTHLNAKEFNYNNLKRFFISLVWRASICQKIPLSLGVYEKIALKILKHEIRDSEALFVPLIYRKETNHVVDCIIGSYGRKFAEHKQFCFRFPNYEVMILTNLDTISNKVSKHQLQEMFSRKGIIIHKLLNATLLDFQYAHIMTEMHKKYPEHP